jgi:F-type H+-transporting ATPase subunit b
MGRLFEGLGINVPTLVAQVVNFGILFVLLYVLAYKRVLKILDERSQKIKDSIGQTERIREQAEQAEDESKRRIEAASKEGQEIIARAVKAGEEVRQQAQQEARREGESLLTKARGEIQRERDESIGELRREFADLTIQVAEKVIERSLDKEAHRQLIEKTLDEMAIMGKG